MNSRHQITASKPCIISISCLSSSRLDQLKLHSIPRVRFNVLTKAYADSEPQFPSSARLSFHIVFSTHYSSSFFLLQIAKKKKSLELSLSAGAEEGWVLSIIKSVLLHQLMGGRGMKVSESFPPH